MWIKKETIALGNDMIDNWDSWRQSHYTFGNGKIEIWTANIPILNLDIYPNIGAFNLIEKAYLHRCIKKSTIRRGISLIKKGVTHE